MITKVAGASAMKAQLGSQGGLALSCGLIGRGLPLFPMACRGGWKRQLTAMFFGFHPTAGQVSTLFEIRLSC